MAIKSKIFKKASIVILSSLLVVASFGALAACGNDDSSSGGSTGGTGGGSTGGTGGGSTGGTGGGSTGGTGGTGGGSTGGGTTGGGSFTVALPADITSTNIWGILGPDSTAYNSYVWSNRYSSPIGLSPTTYQVVPALAAELPTPPRGAAALEGDFYVATVNLKNDINWSDGTPLTAADVAYTAGIVLQLDLPGNWTTAYDDKKLAKVEAVDDTTVKYFFFTSDPETGEALPEPGLILWEYGAGQGLVVAKHFWEPITNPIVAKLTADKSNLGEVQTELYNFASDPAEPHVGAVEFVNREEGQFIAFDRVSNWSWNDAIVSEYGGDGYSETGIGGNYSSGNTSGTPTVVVDNSVGPAELTYSVFQDQTGAVTALKEGDADYFLSPLGLSAGLRAQVAGDTNINIISNPSNGYRYIGFNFLKEPLNDLALRTAIATVVDQEFIATSVLQGAVIPLKTLVPPGNVAWYNESVAGWGVDASGSSLGRQERVEAAVEILLAAGYSYASNPSYNASFDASADSPDYSTQFADLRPYFSPVERSIIRPEGGELMKDGALLSTFTGGKGFFEILSPGPGYDPLRATTAIWIEQWLLDLGIPVKAKLTGFNDIVDQVFVAEARDFDFWILGWGLSPFPVHLQNFYGEDASALGGNNAGSYINPVFEALIDELAAAATVDVAIGIVDRMQVELNNNPPVIPLFSTPIFDAYRNSVEFPYTEVLDGIQNTFSGQTGPVATTLVVQ